MTERSGADWRPVPDPTMLTAAAVDGAKVDLRRELAALREILEARMDAMDNERRLLLQIVNERHAETGRRFAERDIRFADRDAASKDAVRTALDSAKDLSDARDAATDKAGDKFETSVREQIGQIGALAAANRDQLSSEINALKERIDRGEGTMSGAAGFRTERRLDTGTLLGAATLILLIISLILLYATKK